MRLTVLDWLLRPSDRDVPWKVDEPVESIPSLSEGETTEAAQALFAVALGPPATVAGLIRADAILKASIDARMRGHLNDEIACAKGCAHCCVAGINAFPFEALAIADHIRRNWGAFQKWQLMVKLAAYRKKRKGRSCPFLRDGACSIYSVRPAVCRVHHSTDVRDCIREPKRRPSGSEPFYLEAFPIYDGVYGALGDRGGGRNGHDMALAVEVALRNPGAPQEFLDGHDPFVQALRAWTKGR